MIRKEREVNAAKRALAAEEMNILREERVANAAKRAKAAEREDLEMEMIREELAAKRIQRKLAEQQLRVLGGSEFGGV